MTVKWSWFVLFCFLHNAQWHNYFYWNLNDSYRLCNHWYLFVYVYLVLRWCRWSFIFNAMAMLLLFAAIVVALWLPTVAIVPFLHDLCCWWDACFMPSFRSRHIVLIIIVYIVSNCESTTKCHCIRTQDNEHAIHTIQASSC